MRQLRIINLLLALFVLASNAQAQKGDWRAVKQLAPGTPISVKYGRFFVHDRCIFQSATDDVLVCERILYGTSRIFIPPEAVYRRKLVREIRLEHSDASNAAVGAAIGGSIGAALGAAAPSNASARARLSAGLLVGTGGALVGAFVGRDFPIRHREVVYRQ